MTDILSSSIPDQLDQKQSINDQLKELATKIRNVVFDDNVTIHYTVPMNQTRECTMNLKEIEQEGNYFLLIHAQTCKYEKLSSLLKEMKEILEKV